MKPKSTPPPAPLPRLPSPKAQALMAAPPPPTLMERPAPTANVLAFKRPSSEARPFDGVLKGLDIGLIRRR